MYCMYVCMFLLFVLKCVRMRFLLLNYMYVVVYICMSYMYLCSYYVYLHMMYVCTLHTWRCKFLLVYVCMGLYPFYLVLSVS